MKIWKTKEYKQGVKEGRKTLSKLKKFYKKDAPEMVKRSLWDYEEMRDSFDRPHPSYSGSAAVLRGYLNSKKRKK